MYSYSLFVVHVKRNQWGLIMAWVSPTWESFLMKMRVAKGCTLEYILQSVLTPKICHFHFVNIETIKDVYLSTSGWRVWQEPNGNVEIPNK